MGLGFSNKKGNAIIDIAILLIIFVVFAAITVIVYTAAKDINDTVQLDDDLSNATKSRINTVTTGYPSLMDALIVMVLFIMWIAISIAAYYIGSNPAFMPLMLILLVALLVAAIFIGDALTELLGDSSFYLSSFPKTGWILDHLPLICIAFFITTAIALYAGSRT